MVVAPRSWHCHCAAWAVSESPNSAQYHMSSRSGALLTATSKQSQWQVPLLLWQRPVCTSSRKKQCVRRGRHMGHRTPRRCYQELSLVRTGRKSKAVAVGSTRLPHAGEHYLLSTLERMSLDNLRINQSSGQLT